jgi:hypothetical protein
MGKSYYVYLRDTNKINEQHNLVLEESSWTVIDSVESTIDNQIQAFSGNDRRESGAYDDGN